MNTFKIISVSEPVGYKTKTGEAKTTVIISVVGAETIRKHSNAKLIGKAANILMTEKQFRHCCRTFGKGLSADEAANLLLSTINVGTLVGDIKWMKGGVDKYVDQNGQPQVKQDDGYSIQDINGLRIIADEVLYQRQSNSRAYASATVGNVPVLTAPDAPTPVPTPTITAAGLSTMSVEDLKAACDTKGVKLTKASLAAAQADGFNALAAQLNGIAVESEEVL